MLDQERLARLSEDSTKFEQKLTSTHKVREQELLQQIEDLSARLREKEDALRRREDDEFKKNIEYQKLSALVDQKLELTENDLRDYKSKWATKEQEVRELNKELMLSKKELLGFSDKLRIAERNHSEEIFKLKSDHEAALTEVRRNSTTVSA